MEENKTNNQELESQVREFVKEYLKQEASKSTKAYPEDQVKYPKNVASLTLGIISVLTNLFWYICLPTGILAIIFGVKGIKRTGSKVAKGGMICGIVGVSLCLFLYLFITFLYIITM